MAAFLKVWQCVAVPADTTIELMPTAERATGEAEPEVLLKIAS